jgi:hypothetical protein
MTSIEKLLSKIIPPSDYQHRNGFSNNHILANLSNDEWIEVEEELIKILLKSNDNLVGETLSYMKSFKALPALRQKLNLSKNSTDKIIWASYIYIINPNEIEMKDIAFKEFANVKGWNNLIVLFYKLAVFKDERINERIESYVDDNDYLIAYSARTALGYDTKVLIEKEKLKNNIKQPWWKF